MGVLAEPTLDWLAVQNKLLHSLTMPPLQNWARHRPQDWLYTPVYFCDLWPLPWPLPTPAGSIQQECSHKHHHQITREERTLLYAVSARCVVGAHCQIRDIAVCSECSLVGAHCQIRDITVCLLHTAMSPALLYAVSARCGVGAHFQIRGFAVSRRHCVQ